MSGLEADLRLARGGFALDLELGIDPGQVVALLGPNGAGKSTALGALAGLVALDAGSIALAGRCLDRPGDGTFVPPADRRVGVVFQDYLLFPHLDAADNVAFGLRAAGSPRRAARSEALQWLGRMGLADRARSRPSALSGGQAQRVALARALATKPALLLLDEPLAALDAGTRLQVRSDLRHHLSDYPGCTLLVTHDLLDVLALADEVVVVEDGRRVQQGPPGEVVRAPRTPYVARLVGLNLCQGRAVGTRVLVSGGGTLISGGSHSGDVFVAFRPGAVAVHARRPDGDDNTWPGRVSGLEHHADVVRLQVDAEPPVLADVPPAALAGLGAEVGAQVWLTVDPRALEVYPA